MWMQESHPADAADDRSSSGTSNISSSISRGDNFRNGGHSGVSSSHVAVVRRVRRERFPTMLTLQRI